MIHREKKEKRCFVPRIIPVLTGLFFIFGLLGHIQPARAGCTCAPDPLNVRWSNADAIFTGKVMAIDPVPEFKTDNTHDPAVKVVFQVDEVFKGKDINGQIALYTSLAKLTCMGYPFKRNRDYLVFGYMRKAESYETWSLYNYASGTLGTGGLCGGTQPLSNTGAKAEVLDLRKMAAENQSHASDSFLDFFKR